MIDRDNMNKQIKVVIAHPDKQHSFQTAKALIDMGVLDRYITSVYDKPGSLTHFITRFLKGNNKKKLQAHRSDAIPNTKVKQYTEFLSLLLLVLARVDKSGKIYARLTIYRNKVFNKKVARYCKKNRIDMVVSYDVLSGELYEALGEYKIDKVLDMSAPYYPEMCSIFEEEVEKYPTSSLNGMLKTRLCDYRKKQGESEIKNADAFLSASDFTKYTLTKNGADESKIFKCVYGINHSLFNSDGRAKNSSEHLNCVYVGNITELKGCRYLFEAIKKIKADKSMNMDFTVVGAYNSENPLIKEIKHLCTFTGHIIPTELKKILLKSDIMVFPSLADGFGFAVLEAMACGVVPICSKNAGVSDVIQEGKNGFVIEAKDTDAICEKIKLLKENRVLLNEMSKAAAESVKDMKWENYYASVAKSIATVIESKKQ